MWETLGAKLALGIQLPSKKVPVWPHLIGCTGCKHTDNLSVHRVPLCRTDSCLFTRWATVAFVINSNFSGFMEGQCLHKVVVFLPVMTWPWNFRPLRPRYLILSLPRVKMRSLNKLLVTWRRTNAAVTHGDSLQIKPQWVCKCRQWLQRSPHSATQVARRTSVLCKCPCQRVECLECGPMASEPLDQTPPRVWPASFLDPPLACAVFSWRSLKGVSTSGVMILTSGLAGWGPPWPKHISSHVAWGFIFWFETSYWTYFAT